MEDNVGKQKGLRFATFDIETTNLWASYGRLLCACFKFQDEQKPRTFAAARYKDEPRCLANISRAYDEADVIVTWNGKMFDIPYVNARMMVRRRELPKGTKPILDPGKKHIDLLYMSKKLRTQGNKLDYTSRDLCAAHKKYEPGADAWVRAVDGERAALDKIVRHCELDVLITEDMLDILKPYIVRITR